MFDTYIHDKHGQLCKQLFSTYDISSGQKLNLYFLGLLLTSHWLNLQHWTGFYIAVYGNFQGLFFIFEGSFFLCITGAKSFGAPVQFFPCISYLTITSLICRTTVMIYMGKCTLCVLKKKKTLKCNALKDNLHFCFYIPFAILHEFKYTHKFDKAFRKEGASLSKSGITNFSNNLVFWRKYGNIPDCLAVSLHGNALL